MDVVEASLLWVSSSTLIHPAAPGVMHDATAAAGAGDIAIVPCQLPLPEGSKTATFTTLGGIASRGCSTRSGRGGGSGAGAWSGRRHPTSAEKARRHAKRRIRAIEANLKTS